MFSVEASGRFIDTTNIASLSMAPRYLIRTRCYRSDEGLGSDSRVDEQSSHNNAQSDKSGFNADEPCNIGKSYQTS